jgi:molybdopterin-guanine dinucleotide biosynthesis protein B
MLPIVSIVGRSNSGKTTLMEKLIAELKSRGYQVATIKHVHGEITDSYSHKDSDRHLRAGSDAAMVVNPEQLIMVKPLDKETTLEQIAGIIGEDYDIILTEGFKDADAPKMEVHRKENGLPLKDVKKLFAIATDEPLDTKIRQFPLEDIKGIANLIADGFIKPQKERLSLQVNGESIVLSSFPRDFIIGVLLGMVNTLKGVGKIKTLKIFLKKED